LYQILTEKSGRNSFTKQDYQFGKERAQIEAAALNTEE
jgi:hypothetical protein